MYLHIILTPISLFGETVKDRAGTVLDHQSNMKKNEGPIYNDWQRGFEQAKRTGKPLVVVLLGTNRLQLVLPMQ